MAARTDMQLGEQRVAYGYSRTYNDREVVIDMGDHQEITLAVLTFATPELAWAFYCKYLRVTLTWVSVETAEKAMRGIENGRPDRRDPPGTDGGD